MIPRQVFCWCKLNQFTEVSAVLLVSAFDYINTQNFKALVLVGIVWPWLHSSDLQDN